MEWNQPLDNVLQLVKDRQTVNYRGGKTDIVEQSSKR